MKRSFLILAGTVVLPALFLAGLALRKASDQQIVLERQTALLYQQYTDRVAAAVRQVVDSRNRAFLAAVRSLLEREDPRTVALGFSRRLSEELPGVRMGFAVTTSGHILSPTPNTPVPERREFLADNAEFLGNRVLTEVYQSPEIILKEARAKLPETQRNVAPRQSFDAGIFQRLPSKLGKLESDFGSAVATGTSGTLTRFVQDRLEILFWTRPAGAPDIILGAMIRPEDLASHWKPVMEANPLPATGVCVALLNERAVPVYRSMEEFTADWKLPFAATEIGEALPHWEAALYLVNPSQFTEDARWLSTSVVLLVALSLAAMAWGLYAVSADTRRALELAQKKSDFVSNVSHELKSPLTSIRLFAEMLEQNRVKDEGKRTAFLGLIASEAERLTRLINNVLDFSRLDRGDRKVARDVVDLYPVVKRTWEGAEARLSSLGFKTEWRQESEPPYLVAGDPDALSQILVNLVSNSEKYSAQTKEVTLRTRLENGDVCVDVLDRGMGVPAGQEARIFEPFHRAHDSLAGVPGTGLGLALAQRLAAEHRGSIRYRPREGGGSEFTLHLPLADRAPGAAS